MYYDRHIKLINSFMNLLLSKKLLVTCKRKNTDLSVDMGAITPPGKGNRSN